MRELLGHFITVPVDAVAKAIGRTRLDGGFGGPAVIGIEAAVSVKVLQHFAGAVAAMSGEQGEGQ